MIPSHRCLNSSMRQKCLHPHAAKICRSTKDRNHCPRAQPKKYDPQLKQLKDTEKREKYKIYGELLNTYGYTAPEGAKSLEALNYYTNEMITIPLDSDLSALENAKKYFDRYNKLKRTYQALSSLIEETKMEIIHLDSIATSLDIATSESDLSRIKEELTESGYIKKHSTKNRNPLRVSRSTMYLPMDMISMSEKIIIRTMN